MVKSWQFQFQSPESLVPSFNGGFCEVRFNVNITVLKTRFLFLSDNAQFLYLVVVGGKREYFASFVLSFFRIFLFLFQATELDLVVVPLNTFFFDLI